MAGRWEEQGEEEGGEAGHLFDFFDIYSKNSTLRQMPIDGGGSGDVERYDGLR